MKFLLIILLAFSFTACSRKVHVQTSTTQTTAKVKNVAVDTSKTETTETQTTETAFGDSLQGSLFIPVQENATKDTVYVDSLESKGIKIKVGIIPQKKGFKAHINAVAKPVKHTNTTTKTTKTTNGKAVNSNTTTTSKTTTKQKQTQKQSFGWYYCLFLIVPLGIYIIYKKKF